MFKTFFTTFPLDLAKGFIGVSPIEKIHHKSHDLYIIITLTCVQGYGW